jgi:alkylhydroperoxidase family enzyme
MAYIDTVDPAAATGDLKREYDAAVKRARKIYNIVRIMSLRPAHLRASMNLYVALMHGPGELTRAQREMLAVVVSRANDCHY